MRAAHGFPVLLAETFVDPSRFAGTCYRASNWRMLGRTRGFTRLPGSPARWRENGQPKEVYVYALKSDARAALSGIEEPAEWRIGAKEEPMPVPQLHSLYDFLEDIPDFRKARGRRYSIACYLTIAIAARLAGYRGVSAFGEFAARLDDAQRKAVGGFWSPDPSALYRAGGIDLPLPALGNAARHPGSGAAGVECPAWWPSARGHGWQGRARRLEAGRQGTAHDGGRRGTR